MSPFGGSRKSYIVKILQKYVPKILYRFLAWLMSECIAAPVRDFNHVDGALSLLPESEAIKRANHSLKALKSHCSKYNALYLRNTILWYLKKNLLAVSCHILLKECLNAIKKLLIMIKNGGSVYH